MCALVKISASVYFSDHITRGPLQQFSGVRLIQCFTNTKKILSLPGKVEPDTTVLNLSERVGFSFLDSALNYRLPKIYDEIN